MISTDLQISNDEVQLIMSRFYHRNVFQMPFKKNGVPLKNVKWEDRNMSFLRKIVIIHYLMTPDWSPIFL